MPKKGYKHSEETKKKMSKALIGNTRNRGYKRSEETKRKMREAWSDDRKRKFSEAQKGDRNPNFGKTTSYETKKKISVATRGDKSPHWNPNLTDEYRQDRRKYPEYLEWRKAVYERDNYTCQKCGCNKSGSLNSHHIEGYSFNRELQTVVDNGITFCKSCHKEFHRIYGVESTTEKVNNFISGRGYQKLNGETKL
jgi:hypothetical protein